MRRILLVVLTIGVALVPVAPPAAAAHPSPLRLAEPLIPPPPDIPAAPGTRGRSSGAVTIDVLVVFTSAASTVAGGDGVVAALAQAAIDEGNTAYAASGVSHRLRLVGARPVAYTESGSNSTDLTRLTTPGDGFADEVHATRDELGADVVVMFLGDGNFAGTAWQMTAARFAPELMEGFGFAVVVVDFALGDWVVAHELGHILGADHDPDNRLAPGGSGVFPYSLGYREPGSFRTIMAYPCRAGCVQVGHFSNPAVLFAGEPTGSADADNAATINATAATVAAFRPTQVLPPVLGPLDPRIGMVDPRQGLWYLGTTAGAPTPFYFGNPGDNPLAGDWDCDGIETPGMHRPSDGFVYLRNSNTPGIADVSFFFGDPGDVPITGDFDGDGCDTVSIYRPGEGRFYIVNRLGSGQTGLGAADISYTFGDPGDKPFVGVFDGDGVETVGLHRESTGLVYFNNAHRPGVADSQFVFGNPGDRLFAHDWNGDGRDSVGVFRPFERRFYLRYTNTAGAADAEHAFGAEWWLPVAGELGGS